MSASSYNVDDVIVIVASGVFDPEWYLNEYPDIAAAAVDPLLHFTMQGWRENRNPSRHFDTGMYVERYGDQIPSGENPLVFYLRSGWKLGHWPHKDFDPESVNAGHPHIVGLDVCPLSYVLALEARESVEFSGWTEADLIARMHEPARTAPESTPLRTVAFYLPQFHRIPENDQWWGEGFTEWTNTRRGQERYPGHVQPHVPGDLGYYDLDDPTVMPRQASLAKRHGVTAWCFYTYWFQGRRLLSKPLDAFLNDPSIDLEFMVCWANESWTRTWDGSASDILMAQTYGAQDDLKFIEFHARYLRDPRYVRVNDRPVLAVYRPLDLPNPAATAQRWRDWCRDNGIGEIHLVAIEAIEQVDPLAIGFDAAAEYWPNNGQVPDITTAIAGPSYQGKVYDWVEFVRRSAIYETKPYPLYRGVCLSWDSEARRPGWGTSLHGATPALFREWLSNAASEAYRVQDEPSARIVFINAWNEWAEGCHLEPDQHWGYQWLHAVRDVQLSLAPAVPARRLGAREFDLGEQHESRFLGELPGLVVVAHDLYTHGAQMGSLALVDKAVALGMRCEAVALGPGPLVDEFTRRCALHSALPGADQDEKIRAIASDLYGRGFRTAIINSSAGGSAAPFFERAGFHVIGLVHEMRDIIREHGLGGAFDSLVSSSRTVVYASEAVRTASKEWTPRPDQSVRILPQGLYREGLLSVPLEQSFQHKALCGLDPMRPLVLGVGYADHRKGFDIFVDVAIASGPGIQFVWIGAINDADPDISAAVRRASGHVYLAGFQSDPTPWFAAADALLVTSREDPFPSVVIEAAATGTPAVVIKGATGLEDFVSAASGRLCESFEVSVICDAVQRLIEDESDARGVAQRRLRRSFVASSHSFQRYFINLLVGSPSAIPRVSVGIPSYRHVDFLPDRLSTITRQNFPIYEILMLDDVSMDGSVELAKKALLPSGISHVVEENDRNSGSVWRQWHSLARRTDGDYLWIAESDDVAHCGMVDALVADAIAHEAILTFCQSQPLDVTGVVLGSNYSVYTGKYSPSRQWRRGQVFEPGSFNRDAARVFNPILTASSVLFRRRELLQVLDELEPLFHSHPTTADWLVYARLSELGPVSYVPQVLCGHRRHDQSVIGSRHRDLHLDEIGASQRWVSKLMGVHAIDDDQPATYLREMGGQG